jgi:plastocyanin
MNHLALLALPIALLVAGCGGSSGKKSSASTPAPLTQAPAGTKTAATTAGGSVTVHLKNIAFSPKTLTVPVGKKVIWTNDDQVQHNVTATSGASFHSANFGQGGTYSFTPTKKGTIKYVCTLHPGMDATLVVQ